MTTMQQHSTRFTNKSVTYYAKRGYVTTAIMPDVIVMARPKHVNHAVHAILSLMTLGAWLFIWLLVALLTPARTVTISAYDGSVIDKSFSI